MRVPLTYTDAKSLMETARDKSAGKPLQNNTRLYERGEGFGVQLHSTDVVTILPNGRFRISTGGWNTVTTWNRIYSWSPLSWATMSHYRRREGVGSHSYMVSERRVFTRPNPADPEPVVPEVTIPRPYSAPDPGPEPVKSSEGCWAGHRHARGEIKHVMIRASEVRGSDRYEPPSYKWKRHSVRSRDVVAYLEAVMGDAGSYGHVHVDRWVVTVTDYTDERPSYNASQGEKWCPHCEEFNSRQRRWDTAMNGGGWGANRTLGYAPMCRMLERFGSVDEWREAYLTEFRARREGRKEWTEWMIRNSVEFYDGIVVDHQGYILKTHLEAHKLAERKAVRAERRRELELERKRRYEARCKRLVKKRQERLRQIARRDYREMWPVSRTFDNETVDWLIEQMTPPVGRVLISKPYV